jgi:hypothetical protein
MTALEGYRSLEKRDFALSKLSAFGLLQHQKVMLAKRPVRRRFTLVGRQAAHLDVSFVTDKGHTARGAVDVVVRYLRGVTGKVVGEERHQLFADPIRSAAPQRLWLKPPKGAHFAEVEFSRTGRGEKVALDGAMRLQSRERAPALEDFDRILASRDLSAMALLLRQVETQGDRARGLALLARMHFLCHSPGIFRKLTSLRDAVNLERHGITATLGAACHAVTDPARRYTYAAWCHGEAVRDLPLMKHVRAEALCLLVRMGGAAQLEVPAGPGMLGRLLVAALVKKAMPDLVVTLDWAAFRQEPQRFSPWLNYGSGASFLATRGGREVQSLLTSTRL